MRLNRTIRQNWAKTYESNAREILYPSSKEEIINIIKNASFSGTKLKVVGGGDSYNDIFCPNSKGILLSLEKFNKLLSVDREKHQVTFEGGMMMPDLIKLLKEYDMSISNLGTNIFDSVAGACSTGYHGSGINFAIFSSFVVEFEFINSFGEKKTIYKDDKEFDIYAVGLGVLGVITQITLQCEKRFNLEVVEEQMSLEYIEQNFEKLLSENDHFKFIWIPHTDNFMVWLGNRTTKKPDGIFKKFIVYFWYGVVVNNLFHELLLFIASFKRGLVKSINRLMAKILLPKSKGTSVWQSEWAFFLPHLLKQDVVEYAFDIKDTFKVFRQVIEQIKAQNIEVDTPIEVRFVKSDSYWMSPTGQSDSCWIGTKIHFPYGKKPEYQKYFTLIDSILLQYNGRPHWGKQFRISSSDFKKAYPKWDDFWNYVDKQDPKGIFQNEFIQRLRGE
jgi:FAD/FMN-containing dehydrogenase